MPKTTASFDPDRYAPVAERIRLFYREYPRGRITTHLISRTVRETTFLACVYRAHNDTRPAATGWAAEREGDGDVNLVACLENTETSAIGRALANLGFTASTQRPSAEEMLKASRSRARLFGDGARRARSAATSDALDDLLDLLAQAVRAGFDESKAERLRTRLFSDVHPTRFSIVRLERALRKWLIGRHEEDG